MPVRAACFAILLLGANLSAQRKIEEPTTRTLEGMVTNALNQPVSNAVVQLKNSKTLQIRSFITQDDGRYHFAGLGTDEEYQIKAGHDSVHTSWKTLSVFNSKRTPVINLKLKK